MLGLFQDRKQLVAKYGVAARAMIADFGEAAQDRALERASQCRPGSRDRRHWDSMAKTIGYMEQ